MLGKSRFACFALGDGYDCLAKFAVYSYIQLSLRLDEHYLNAASIFVLVVRHHRIRTLCVCVYVWCGTCPCDQETLMIPLTVCTAAL